MVIGRIECIIFIIILPIILRKRDLIKSHVLIHNLSVLLIKNYSNGFEKCWEFNLVVNTFLQLNQQTIDGHFWYLEPDAPGYFYRFKQNWWHPFGVFLKINLWKIILKLWSFYRKWENIVGPGLHHLLLVLVYTHGYDSGRFMRVFVFHLCRFDWTFSVYQRRKIKNPNFQTNNSVPTQINEYEVRQYRWSSNLPRLYYYSMFRLVSDYAVNIIRVSLLIRFHYF